MKNMRVSLAFAFCLTMPAFAGAADQRVAKGLSSLPAEARASISAAVGRDNPAYEANARTGVFSVQTATHGLIADFTSDGVEVRSGRSLWRMALRGYGYGKTLKPMEAAAPSASANRVEYRHGSLTEWYVNGPGGLEQGFTIDKPPGKANGQPLTIALALSGDFTAAVDSSRTGLALADREKRTELRYAGLTAYDAGGKKLRAWLELRGEQLSLKADDAKARYPVVIDPWVELAELTASDSTSYSFLGASVAMSGDAIVMGAPGDTVGSNNSQGAAYVFVKPNSGWQNTSDFTAKLTARDGQIDDGFGAAVSIQRDTVVIGSPNATVNFNQGRGAAYVFIKPKSGWKTTSKFTSKLTASDGNAGDNFGCSVSTTPDTTLIGAAGASVNQHSSQGVAYVFVKPKSGWKTTSKFTGKLASSDGKPNDFFGATTSLSGNVIAIGAYGHDHYKGELYVFSKPVRGWKNMAESAKLTASDGHPGDRLAFVSANQGAVVGGAPLATVGNNQEQGSAYVFIRPPGGWHGMVSQKAKLTVSDGNADDWFGSSVSLSGDSVAVGASNVSRGKGAVYVFKKPRSGWRNTSKYIAELTAPNGAENDNLGFSVFAYGANIVSGAPNVIINQSSAGAGYVFGANK